MNHITIQPLPLLLVASETGCSSGGGDIRSSEYSHLKGKLRVSGKPKEEQLSPQRNWAALQFLYSLALTELDSHFTHLTMPYMPIKGAYHIINGSSEEFASRKMADIDILVAKENYRKACVYFRGIEGTVVRHENKFETAMVVRTAGLSIPLEIHNAINFRSYFDLNSEHLFERGIRKSNYLWLPCREDALLILVGHTLTHIGLFWVPTIFQEITILTRGHFEWEKFWKNAHKSGLKEFAAFLLGVYLKDEGTSFPGFAAQPYTLWATDHFGKMDYKREGRVKRLLLYELPFVRHPVTLMLERMLRLVKTRRSLFLTSLYRETRIASNCV